MHVKVYGSRVEPSRIGCTNSQSPMARQINVSAATAPIDRSSRRIFLLSFRRQRIDGSHSICPPYPEAIQRHEWAPRTIPMVGRLVRSANRLVHFRRVAPNVIGKPVLPARFFRCPPRRVSSKVTPPRFRVEAVEGGCTDRESSSIGYRARESSATFVVPLAKRLCGVCGGDCAGSVSRFPARRARTSAGSRPPPPHHADRWSRASAAR